MKKLVTSFRHKKGRARVFVFTAGVVLIILTVILLVAFKKINLPASKENHLDRDAVFLANGQVYFGEIERQDSRYLVLKNIYYLKAQEQLNVNNPDKQVSIIKLGDEVHGPEDQMYINRSQVLFYEKMRNDSKINQAIERYLTEKK